MIAALAAVLLLAVPRPGSTAAIDVSVATLWRAPGLARAIDAPALANPVDLDRWNRNLATAASRRWLGSRVVTQALYGETVKGCSKTKPLDRRHAPHRGPGLVRLLDAPGRLVTGRLTRIAFRATEAG